MALCGTHLLPDCGVLLLCANSAVPPCRGCFQGPGGPGSEASGISPHHRPLRSERITKACTIHPSITCPNLPGPGKADCAWELCYISLRSAGAKPTWDCITLGRSAILYSLLHTINLAFFSIFIFLGDSGMTSKERTEPRESMAQYYVH